jgi:hypothetical protein
MKRLILLIVVVLLAYWVLARHQAARMHRVGPGHRNGPHFAQDRDAMRHTFARAGHDVKQALRDAGHDIRHAVGEASEDIRDAFGEMSEAFVSDDDGAPAVVERQEAEGLPVKIVPGTRVTEAHPVPPVPPRRVVIHRSKDGRVVGAVRPVAPVAINMAVAEIPTLAGQISANTKRADDAARVELRETISAWLEPDVPTSWSLPERELDRLVLETKHETKERKDDLGPMYITHLKLDTTPAHREQLIKLYNRELVGHRLINLGGSLTFILMCLAAVSGYIRADEATKGYYTNRLRMLAAAAVGAGGVLIYQMLT